MDERNDRKNSKDKQLEFFGLMIKERHLQPIKG